MTLKGQFETLHMASVVRSYASGHGKDESKQKWRK